MAGGNALIETPEWTSSAGSPAPSGRSTHEKRDRPRKPIPLKINSEIIAGDAPTGQRGGSQEPPAGAARAGASSCSAPLPQGIGQQIEILQEAGKMALGGGTVTASRRHFHHPRRLHGPGGIEDADPALDGMGKVRQGLHIPARSGFPQ